MGPQKYLGLLVDVLEDGTIKLPEAMLNGAGIVKGSKVEVFATDTHLFLRTIDEECSICGTNGKMKNIGGRLMCNHCIHEIKQSITEESN